MSIRNISSRGMMLAADEPPPPGAYLEIRKAMMIVVARAVWVRDGCFGIRTQDRVDLNELLDNAQARPADWQPGSGRDRRAASRVNRLTPAERAERSRQRGQMMQFAALLIVIVGTAAFIALEVADLLATPLRTISRALGG